MFELKAGVVIQVHIPPSTNKMSAVWYDTNPWKPYTTKETKLYDSHEVFDAVAVHNDREMPMWMHRNITEFGKTVIAKDGYFALVNPKDITYID